MRPAQFSQILPTPPLGWEPRSKLLIRPRIVTPADRTVANHEHTLLHSSRYAGHVYDSGGRGSRGTSEVQTARAAATISIARAGMSPVSTPCV